METKMDNIKVMIADDEEEFASTLSTRLKLRKFHTTTCNSGTTALSAIDEDQPDILVLDLKMPDLDGLEVLAEVKENYPKIEVIMLTGHGSFEAGREGMELGAYDYIMKPVDLGLLVEKIIEAYQKSERT